LPKKRRRTEVSVPYSGGGGAIGWDNNTLKIGVVFGCDQHPHFVRPRIACGARPPILKVKLMVPSILQGDSLKRLLQGAAAAAAVTMNCRLQLGRMDARKHR
jgi:hypothetical protein